MTGICRLVKPGPVALFVAAHAIAAQAQTLPDEHRRGTGTLVITSNPPDARVILDGAETGLTTPATLTSVTSGEHTVELSIPDYLFSRRRVDLPPDSVVTLSFELITGFDTTHVKGRLRLGLLALPRPPVHSAYAIDGRPVAGLEVTLNEGLHHVEWDGGSRYGSLDTVVTIAGGQVTTFSFRPERRTGRLGVRPEPADAEVQIDGRFAGLGPIDQPLPTGTYLITLRRRRYRTKHMNVTVFPDSTTLLNPRLALIPDRDEDGFIDAVDMCPDTYGLYEGCSKPSHLRGLAITLQSIQQAMENDPFCVAATALGFQRRIPTNREFRSFLAYFNDGPAVFTNSTGLVAGNAAGITWRGFRFAFELGQWNTALNYRKNDTLSLNNAAYTLLFDSTGQMARPRILIPSTALETGFHLAMGAFSFSGLLGYRWEDIIVADLVNMATGDNERFVFDNDGWYTGILVDSDFDMGWPAIPSAYVRFDMQFGKAHITSWHSFQIGGQFKYRIPDAVPHGAKDDS
jgi:hypothetical protein